MADVLDVVTEAEARSALNDTNSQIDATELDSYITAVSKRLDALVGPIVIRSITNELHDGGGYVISLDYAPVSSITSISERWGTTAYTLVAENYAAPTAYDYILDPNAGVIYRRWSGCDRAFYPGKRNVVVSYSAGRFANTGAVDARYKQAAAMWLTHLWRQEQGASSTTFGGQAPSSLPAFGVPNVISDMLEDQLAAPRVGR